MEANGRKRQGSPISGETLRRGSTSITTPTGSSSLLLPLSTRKEKVQPQEKRWYVLYINSLTHLEDCAVSVTEPREGFYPLLSEREFMMYDSFTSGIILTFLVWLALLYSLLLYSCTLFIKYTVSCTSATL